MMETRDDDAISRPVENVTYVRCEGVREKRRVAPRTFGAPPASIPAFGVGLKLLRLLRLLVNPLTGVETKSKLVGLLAWLLAGKQLGW